MKKYSSSSSKGQVSSLITFGKFNEIKNSQKLRSNLWEKFALNNHQVNVLALGVFQ